MNILHFDPATRGNGFQLVGIQTVGVLAQSVLRDGRDEVFDALDKILGRFGDGRGNGGATAPSSKAWKAEPRPPLPLPLLPVEEEDDGREEELLPVPPPAPSPENGERP